MKVDERMIQWHDRADMFFRDKFNAIEKNSLLNSIERFLNNEKSGVKQTYLLDIVLLMDWISQNEIIDFIYEKTYYHLEGNDYLLRFKEDLHSSSNLIINRLLENRAIFEDNIININDETKLISLQNSTINIFIADDFSGTGDTFWKNIKKISRFCKLNLTIVIYAWTETAINNIMRKCSGETNILTYRIIKSNKQIKRYDDLLTGELLNYVNNLSRKIDRINNKYGYKNSGTMVSLNGLSPNNNLPMIWDSNLVLNENLWSPLLNRKFKLEILEKVKKIVFKQNKEEFYKIYKSRAKKICNLREFQLLYILYTMKYITFNTIQEYFGFDSILELRDMLNKLESRGIIIYDNGFYNVTNDEIVKCVIYIDNIISKDLLTAIRNDPKQVNFKFAGKRKFTYNNSNDVLP